MRSLPVAVLVATALTLAGPHDARAQSAAPEPPLGYALFEIAGLVTDVGIPISLERTGHASLWLSIPGTVIWSVNALAGLELLALSQNGGYLSNDGAAADVFLVISGASLALSIYGIVRRPPPVSVAPTALRSPSGQLVPALAMSARW